MVAVMGRERRKVSGRLGQVVVEMLLILPVFLTIVFTIPETGHIAFWMIVLNHATYEVARIGALKAGPKPGDMNVNVKDVTGEMRNLMPTMIRGAKVESRKETTLIDGQAGVQNYDLVVIATFDVPFVFPTSPIVLGKGRRFRTIRATVRMPIEQPLSK